jgi:tetratricopeptide (TPR) repeat protein
MRWIMGLFLVIAAVPVSAQQAPRPTEVGEEALNDLIRRGLEAGGLVRAPDPESDHPALAPGDAARLRAAVAADRAALTPELRDLLIARVAGADPSQRPAFLALLRSLGEVTQDDRALAVALSFEAEQVQPRDPAAAIPLWEEAARRFAACKKPEGQAFCLNNLGVILMEQGDFDRALEVQGRALAIRRQAYEAGRSGADYGQTQSYTNIANIHHARGDYARALQLYEYVLNVRLNALLSRVRELEAMRRDPGEPSPERRRALDGLQRDITKRRADIATTYYNAAVVYAEQGDVGRALGLYEKALAKRLEVSGDRDRLVALCYSGMGQIHYLLGDLGEAFNLQEKALRIRLETLGGQHPDVADSFNHIAIIHHGRHEYPEALEGFQKALAIFRAYHSERHPDVARCYDNLALVHGDSGTFDRARAELDRALHALSTAADPDPSAPPPTDAAHLRPLLVTAKVLFDRASIHRRALGPKASAQDLRTCLRDYQAAAEVLEEVRDQFVTTSKSKLQHGEDAANLFVQTIGVARRLAEAEESPERLLAAFAAAEQGTARVFLENLGRARATAPGGSEPLAGEADLDARVHQLEAQIDQQWARVRTPGDREAVHRLLDQQQEARRAARTRVRDLEGKYPRYAALMYPKPCSIEQARACLADDEVALLYVLGAEESYLIVLAREDDPKTAGLTIHSLPPADAIFNLVTALTQPAALQDDDSARDLGAQAHRMLLAPAAGAIRGKNLVIVPGGVLGLLPFELLIEPTEGVQAGSGGDGRFLVQGHRIRYTPSMTTLHIGRRWDETRTRPDRPLWAVGDPVYQPTDKRLPTRAELEQLTRDALTKYQGGVPGASFERLLSSGAEVEQLRRLWEAPAEAIRLGPAATEAAVKAASASGELTRYRYVHFATHGVLGPAEAAQPALVLSLAGDQKGEDGFLRLDEVTGLRLNADLVVLSACQTGQGRLSNAEGVSGLARAFLYAGSRGVLCSLWRVDDEATADLMVAVYAGLKAGRPAPEALRAAQLERLAGGDPPRAWAPFILIGQ